MFPTLYENVERDNTLQQAPRFIVPQHHGLGVLSDCISCECEQERNGIYELVFEYPASGIHAQDIALMRFVKERPNFNDDPQLFFVDRIGKTLNGKFTVYCKHISYLLSGYTILSGSAINAVKACELLRDATNKDFYIHTNKDVVADFNITEPSSVKSWFVGKEGSFLDVFGASEIKYNNFDINFMAHAGVTEPRVTVRYGKNLLELSQEMDSSNLYTHVMCYYKSSEGVVVSGEQQATGLQLNVLRSLVLDVSSEYEGTPTVEELNERARKYIRDNNLIIPLNNITLDFVQSGELTGRVDLCDVVNIHYDALGIDGEMKCIHTKYDCLREKYIETEFGDVKKTLADTISDNTSRVNDAVSTADSALSVADSKKRVFISEPIPPYDVGDLWIVDDNNVSVCIVSRSSGNFDSDDWGSAIEAIDNDTMHSAIESAIDNATTLITGGVGGNLVILRNVDSGGNPTTPYEIAIFDTHPNDPQDLEHAWHVWRWNMGGLAYSSEGYGGKFTTAINSNGQIVADFITTGTLHAGEITVMGLKASMFEGQEIDLGGSANPNGVLKILDKSNNPLVVMNSDGIECFGKTEGGITPSVVFNKNGMTGYSNSADKQNTAIFWTTKDSFNMSNGIVKNQLSIGGKIKMVPFTIRNSNNEIVNDGIAEVPID